MPYIATGLRFWNQPLHLIRHVRQVPSLVHSIACRCLVVTEPAHKLMVDNAFGHMANNVPMCMQYITLPTCFWIAIPNRPNPMADSDSSQIKLFRECSRAFLTRDTALLAKTTHADYRYVPYPRSLGEPEQKKEEFLEHWAEAMSHWTPDTEVSCIGCSSDHLRRD
jgi:hypothetical protein